MLLWNTIRCMIRIAATIYAPLDLECTYGWLTMPLIRCLRLKASVTMMTMKTVLPMVAYTSRFMRMTRAPVDSTFPRRLIGRLFANFWCRTVNWKKRLTLFWAVIAPMREILCFAGIWGLLGRIWWQVMELSRLPRLRRNRRLL